MDREYIKKEEKEEEATTFPKKKEPRPLGYGPTHAICCCPFHCCYGLCYLRLPFSVVCASCITEIFFGVSHAKYDSKKFDRPTLTKMEEMSYLSPDKSMFETIIEDVQIPATFSITSPTTISLRVFKPKEGTLIRNVIVHFPGGGFVMGRPDVKVPGTFLMLLASQGFIVVAVNYRKIPENPFPLSLCDAYDAVEWAYQQYCTTNTFVLSGDSAGGNLAYSLTTLFRDQLSPYDLTSRPSPVKIVAQVLLYPVIYFHQPNHSFVWKNSFILQEGFYEFACQNYIQGSDARVVAQNERRVNPTLAGFHNLPSTLVYYAEYDYLRKENELLIKEMKASGKMDDIIVEKMEMKQAHGFVTNPSLSKLKKYVKTIVDFLEALPAPVNTKEEQELVFPNQQQLTII